MLDHDNRPTTLVVPQRRTDGLWQAVRLDVVAGEPVSRFIDRVIQSHDEQFCNRIWGRQGPGSTAPGEQPTAGADVVTRLQATLYAACGLDDMLYLPVSRLSASEAFGALLASVLSDPMHFSHCYNQAVAGQAHGEAPGRSGGIRPLAADHQGISAELPFWLVRSDGRRTSLHVRPENESIILSAGACGELARLRVGCVRDNSARILEVLEEAGWAIRPKAVALTLFARLYLSDWFIHGLGGVQYERVTDYLLREYYRMRVPAYGMITCTAILPSCRSDRASAGGLFARPCPHHVRHNPQERLGEPECWPPEVKRLVDKKRKEIAVAGDRAAPAERRKAAWQSILAINRQLRDYADGHTQSGEQTIARPEEWKVSRGMEGSREYFFGLFPESELMKLAASVTFPCSTNAPQRSEHVRSTHPVQGPKYDGQQDSGDRCPASG